MLGGMGEWKLLSLEKSTGGKTIVMIISYAWNNVHDPL
jgi:hypothetical protein